MSYVPPAEPGSALDRQIARQLDGMRHGREPAPYSTDEGAALRLVERLGACGISPEFEQDDEQWYCVFRLARADGGAGERVASGSATTRALAICRAVLNLPLTGTGSRLRLRTASRGWIGSDDAEPRPVPPVDAESGPDVATESATEEVGESPGPPRAARRS
jgi:hypothetical protein